MANIGMLIKKVCLPRWWE